MSEGGAFIAGSIIGKLVLDKMGWDSAIKDVDKDKQKLGSLAGEMSDRFSGMGKAMTVAGGAIVASVGAMMKSVADTGDVIAKLSDKTGVSTEMLSGYKLAVDLGGSSIEGFATGLKKLAKGMDEANTGGKTYQEAFESIGVAWADGEGKLRPLNDVLLDVADRFATMPDGPKKSAVAMELLGKAGTELIPTLNLGAAGLRKNYEEAEKMGLIFSHDAAGACEKFNDSFTNLQSAGAGLAKELTVALMPAITDLVDDVRGVVTKVREWAAEHPELVSGIVKIVTVAGGLMAVLGPILIILPKLIAGWGALKGSMEGVSVTSVATKAAIGILIVEVAKYISILQEKKKAEEYEKEAGARLVEQQAKLAEKLRKAGEEAGWQAGAMDALITKYDGNVAALAMAIKKGQEGIDIQAALANVGKEHAAVLEAEQKAQEQATLALKNKRLAQEAAKKAQEEYTAYLNGLGIYTDEQNAEALKKVWQAEKDVTEAYDSGKIKADVYSAAIQTLTDEASKHGGVIKTQVLPPARDLDAVLAACPTKLKDAELGYQNLDEAMEGTADQMGVSVATVQMMVYELNRLQLAAIGITLPDLRIPSEQKTQVATDVDDFKNLWDGFFNDVSGKWGDTINDFISGNTSIVTAWNRLWKNMGETITDFIGKYITEKLIKAIQGIIEPSKSATGAASEAFSSMGETIGGVASGVGSVITTLASAIGTVITELAGAIGTGIVTIAEGISVAIVALAEGIATAATTLAAAAPSLLIVGGVALALYAGFSAIGAILSSGGGGAGDGMGRVVERQDRFLAGWSWWYLDMARMTDYLCNRADRRTDQLDNLSTVVANMSNEVCNRLDKINNSITNVPAAAKGGIVPLPTFAKVGEVPEVIVPIDQLGGLANSIARTPGGVGGGGKTVIENTVEVGMKPVVIDKGDRWFISFIQDHLNHGGLRVPAAAVGG